jgi:ribonucleoside-diphosphate reductase alpha chain
VRGLDECSEKYQEHLCKSCGKVHETIEELLERCSFGVDAFYNLLASRDFLPNSPTLFNAGTGQGTYSGCFKFDVQDSMESIMSVASKSAFVQKWGGGVGYCLSELRPFGADIRTTHGRACGPIAVLELYHAVAEMITQGGKRSGAQMGMLHCDHADIEKFICCKDGGKNLSTFNISVACTNKFMHAVDDSTTREHRIFEQIVESAWKTGDPGIYFIDAAEQCNPTPWLGKLTGTNPCGEVPLLDNEPCNLGSINLDHMFDNGQVDFDKLECTVRLAVRYLDTVLDNNGFPDPAITAAALRTRKLGLGVMGWADLLTQMHIHYDTDEAVRLGEEIMLRIQRWSHDESRILADEKGAYPAYAERSDDYADIPYQRNACITCIAPAGTISKIADCSAGIEPYFTLKGTHMMGDGTLLEEKVTIKAGGFIPHVALQIDSSWQILHQAAFQRHTDLAVSKTVNLPNTVTKDQVRNVFKSAWINGCKGITIYRHGSRSVQVINETEASTSPLVLDTYATDAKFGQHRRKMPMDAEAKRHKFVVGGMEGYLHTGLLFDGAPGEVFITGANQGSTVSGLLASLSIMTSLALQHGVPLETMVEKLQYVRFEPRGMTSNPDIPTATSVVAYIFRYLGKKFLSVDESGKSMNTGMLCEECGAPAFYEEGCLKCTQCDWTRCG